MEWLALAEHLSVRRQKGPWEEGGNPIDSPALLSRPFRLHVVFTARAWDRMRALDPGDVQSGFGYLSCFYLCL